MTNHLKTSETTGQAIGRPRSFSDSDVFEAVLNVLEAQGYAHLTMNSIAKELGYTAPALMSRFGSKNGLFQAFMEWRNKLAADHFAQVIEAHDSPLEALRARFRSAEKTARHEYSAQFDQLNILVFHVVAWSTPELHDLELERRHIYLENIIALLGEAKTRGEIAGCDPPRFGRTMLAAIVGAAQQWDINPIEETGYRIVAVIDELLRPYLVEKAAQPEGRARS